MESDLDHVSQAGPETPAQRKPTPMDWDAIRPLFEDLWWTQHRPLRTVMDTLGRTKSFVASERQFKIKIHQWGLERREKKAVMLSLAREIEARESRGKKSAFLVRDKVVTAEDVHQYLRKRNIQAPRSVSNDDRSSWTRHDIRVYTPASSPQATPATDGLSPIQELQLEAEIPSAVSPPRLDTSARKIVESVNSYYSVMFKSNAWVMTDVDEQYLPLQFGGEFLKFHNLYKLRQHGEAYIVLGNAHRMIKILLKAGHPRLLVYLLESIAFTRSEGYEDVARGLIDFFAWTSSQPDVLGPNHPISVFGHSLRQADSVSSSGLIELALRFMIEQFVENITDEHDETMALLLTSASILKHQKNYYDASTRLDQLQKLYEKAFTPHSYQVCHAIADHAAVKAEMKDFDDGRDLLLQALTRSLYIDDAQMRAEARIRCFINWSTLCKAEEDVEGMHLSLEEALRLGEELPMDDEHWMMRHTRAMIASAPPKPISPPQSSSMMTPASVSSG